MTTTKAAVPRSARASRNGCLSTASHSLFEGISGVGVTGSLSESRHARDLLPPPSRATGDLVNQLFQGVQHAIAEQITAAQTQAEARRMWRARGAVVSELEEGFRG